MTGMSIPGTRHRARFCGLDSRDCSWWASLFDWRFQPPIHPGPRRSASSGTMRAPGCTTRATWRSSDDGARTRGIRCTSPRCSPASNTCRSRSLALDCGRRGWSLSSRGQPRSCSSRCGVRRIAGREAGSSPRLLATNYVYVMWNRAALMEASMVAFMVAAWYCYVRAQTRPFWGGLAAACALLAYFTKAAAIFFVAALGIEAVLDPRFGQPLLTRRPAARRPSPRSPASSVCGIVALALFVMPNWTDYRFYNWQMSVTRKPSYDAQSLMNRVTWFPIVHDIFTRMWFTVGLASWDCSRRLARWRTVSPAERLLALWIVLRRPRAAAARRRQRTPVRVLHSRRSSP